MVHFYESSIVITKDNLYCKVFANEHPEGYLIAKPKYIPSNKISSTVLPLRYLFGQSFHRLDMWKDKNELNNYKITLSFFITKKNFCWEKVIK